MKLAVFVSYFVPTGGRLPNYFSYWMKSASKNASIDFYIPTNADVKSYEKYSNIKFLCMSVEEFWKKVQEIFDFPITKGFYKIAEYEGTEKPHFLSGSFSFLFKTCKTISKLVSS